VSTNKPSTPALRIASDDLPHWAGACTFAPAHETPNQEQTGSFLWREQIAAVAWMAFGVNDIRLPAPAGVRSECRDAVGKIVEIQSEHRNQLVWS